MNHMKELELAKIRDTTIVTVNQTGCLNFSSGESLHGFPILGLITPERKLYYLVFDVKPGDKSNKVRARLYEF